MPFSSRSESESSRRRARRELRPELTALEDRVVLSTSAHRVQVHGVHAHVRRPAPKPGSSAAISNVLEDVIARTHVPGMAAAVIVGGRVSGIGVAGIRAAGSGADVRTNDRFFIGSAGKAMTATLAARLVQAGRIDWTTTIAQAFPELSSKIRPEYRYVTLEQLLAHRGGIVDTIPDELTARLQGMKAGPAQVRAAAVLPLLQLQPAGTPGSTFTYSNFGYALAAAMMERKTGLSYEALMSRYVFRPLGMTTAGFGAPGRSGRVVDQPRGHTDGGVPVDPNSPVQDPPALDPAGLVHMSMADWAKFVRVQLGNVVSRRPFLDAATIERMQRAYPGPGMTYALGWAVYQGPNGTALIHDGSDDRWFAQVVALPGRNAAVLVAANQGSPALPAVQSAMSRLLASIGIS